MSRSLAVPLAAVLLWLVAVPGAGAATFCVSPTPCVGGTVRPSLDAALDSAESLDGDDVVRLGSGTFTHSSPASYSSPDSVAIVGAGPQSTTVRRTGPDAPLLEVRGSGGNVVESLTLDLESQPEAGVVGDADLSDISATRAPDNPFGDTGIALFSGSVQDCDVFAGDNGLAIHVAQTSTSRVDVANCYLEGWFGVYAGNDVSIDGVSIFAENGVRAIGGTTHLSNAEIELRPDDFGGTAVASNPEDFRPTALIADHLTVIGQEDDVAADAGSYIGETSSLLLRNSAVLGEVAAGRCYKSAPEEDDPSLSIAYTAVDTTSSDLSQCDEPASVFSQARPPADESDFVDAGAADFRLTTGSALINQGEPGGLDPDESPVDILGYPRIAGGIRDLGAHEFQGATPPAGSPAKPPPAGPSRPRLRPTVTRLRLSRRKFRAAFRGASIGRYAVGTRVSYALSAPASVRWTIERAASGRRVSGTCRAVTRRNAKRRRCRRYVRLKGSFRHAGQTGTNSFRFTGRLRHRRLRPGSYRLVGRPAGATKSIRARFSIVR